MPLGLVGEDIVVLNEPSLWSGGPFQSPVSIQVLCAPHYLAQETLQIWHRTTLAAIHQPQCIRPFQASETPFGKLKSIMVRNNQLN
jgi:hypothetical protein